MGQKPCQFTKEDTQIADKYEKMLHIICHQGNAKQQETTTRLLGQPKSGTLTIPNTGRDMKQQEFSFVAGWNANWYSHFGRQYGSFL